MEDCCEEQVAMAREVIRAGKGRVIKLSEKIKCEQQTLEERIADLKKAQEILQKNPDIEELLNILGRSGRNFL